MGSATRKIANAFSTSGIISSTNINNASLDNITSITGSGQLTFISKQTASASATIDFTSGIDSTYKEYVFYFVNIHPATDEVIFQFQGNAVGGSGYNETITSSFFRSYHYEDDSSNALAYYTTGDQAQGTAFQYLTGGPAVGNDNDQCCSGELRLFNPSSTTFVKHFIAVSNTIGPTNYTMNDFSAGYFNTTSAIDQIQFKFSSGNIDAGTIYMYGIGA